jgi:hypothetical protein
MTPRLEVEPHVVPSNTEAIRTHPPRCPPQPFLIFHPFPPAEYDLCDAELRFHPTKEMRLSALLGPQHPVAVRTFRLRRERGYRRAARDEVREKIGRQQHGADPLNRGLRFEFIVGKSCGNEFRLSVRNTGQLEPLCPARIQELGSQLDLGPDSRQLNLRGHPVPQFHHRDAAS